jgi:hypothetical protein
MLFPSIHRTDVFKTKRSTEKLGAYRVRFNPPLSRHEGMSHLKRSSSAAADALSGVLAELELEVRILATCVCRWVLCPSAAWFNALAPPSPFMEELEVVCRGGAHSNISRPMLWYRLWLVLKL